MGDGERFELVMGDVKRRNAERSQNASQVRGEPFAKAAVEGDVDLLSGITFRRPRPDPPLRESLRRA